MANTEMILGMIVGIVVGLILVVCMLKFSKTDGSNRCKYDERQELVRGRGFKYGFLAMLLYYAVYGYLGLVMESLWVDHFTGVIVGLLLGMAVYASYSIWNDGYLALNENPKRLILFFIIMGGINLAFAVMHILDGAMIEHGILTYRSVNLFCGGLFVIIGVVALVKCVRDKRDED